MSKHRPTQKEQLEKKLQAIYETLELFDKHEKSWGEDETYSANWTRKALHKQINNIHNLIETCEG